MDNTITICYYKLNYITSYQKIKMVKSVWANILRKIMHIRHMRSDSGFLLFKLIKLFSIV